jgi:CubicO group peptidase (beta-lactamase class C family)
MATTWASDVQEVLTAAVQGGAVPGVVVAVTGPGCELDVLTAGKLRIDEEAPVQRDTMFRLMSMTKSFASVAALQLIEQGRLRLDQDVTSVLPAFGALKILDGFDGDTPRLREPTRQATIRNLLNHTAGHGYGFCNADLLRYQQVTGTPDPFSGLRAGLNMPLVADPGTEWNYGINTDWLGQVVEAISGQDLAEYLDEHLFTPLGMSDTSFAPSNEQRARLMSVHQRMEGGHFEVTEIAAPAAAPEFWPAGHGAFGTASDYARFLAMLLNDGELDGERILKAETVELAFEDHLDGVSLPKIIRSALPAVSNDIPSAPFAQGWGLGFHLFTEDLPGMRRAGSGDWAGLCNSYYWVDRAGGVGGVFLTQVLPFFDMRTVETAGAVEATVYAGSAAPA